MVESSIGISAPLLIGEESILDPVIGIVTGIAYGGVKVFDKIRNKNKDDYSIDVLVNEEQKQPVDQTLQNWRNIRQRDANRYQWAHQQPIQEDEIEPTAEDFSWEGIQEIRPQAQDPVVVIQNDEQLDQLHLIPKDVQQPIEQNVQTQDEMNLYPPDMVRQVQEPEAQNMIDNEQQFNELEQRDVDQNEPEIPRQIPQNDPDPDPNGNGNDPDPGGNNNGNNNNQQEENKDNQISNQIQQIANRITQLQNNKKDKEQEKNDDKSADFDKERQKYIADIEFQIRSQQSLIDILKRFQDQQIDAKQVSKELDDIEDYILEQRALQFTEDFVYSDVISTF